LQHAIEFF